MDSVAAKNTELYWNMSWENLCSTSYLQGRLDKFLETVFVADNGCHFSSLARRSNGDARIKLRSQGREWDPRPWRVALFLEGVTIPVGHNASHVCGRGLRGCVNQSHIVIEPHSVNLDRKDCHKTTTCPCCLTPHRVRTDCPHTPKCI